MLVFYNRLLVPLCAFGPNSSVLRRALNDLMFVLTVTPYSNFVGEWEGSANGCRLHIRFMIAWICHAVHTHTQTYIVRLYSLSGFQGRGELQHLGCFGLFVHAVVISPGLILTCFEKEL